MIDMTNDTTLTHDPTTGRLLSFKEMVQANFPDKVGPKGAVKALLGDTQWNMLESLCDHGYWSAGSGWVWTNTSQTTRVLDSLVKRGLVVKEEKASGYRNWAPRFTPDPEVNALWTERKRRLDEAANRRRQDEQAAYAESRRKAQAHGWALDMLTRNHPEEYASLVSQYLNEHPLP